MDIIENIIKARKQKVFGYCRLSIKEETEEEKKQKIINIVNDEIQNKKMRAYNIINNN